MGGRPRDSILSKAFYPLGLAIAGFGTAGISNNYNKRPFFAGIQRHIVCAIVGGLFGLYVNGYSDRKYMKRDAIIRHYIELHPEDFKDEKRQYKEVFAPWIPIR